MDLLLGLFSSALLVLVLHYYSHSKATTTRRAFVQVRLLWYRCGSRAAASFDLKPLLDTPRTLAEAGPKVFPNHLATHVPTTLFLHLSFCHFKFWLMQIMITVAVAYK